MIHIGIDVDLTTLASDEAWWNWLYLMSVAKYDRDPVEDLHRFKQQRWGKMHYGLPEYFPHMINHNVNPFDFWRNEGVYDLVRPVPGAREAIKRLIRKENFRVVFVTHNKGNGGRSKYNLLDRLFDRRNFDYVVTKEKYLINVDCLIDDRFDFLNPCAERGIKSFCYKTPYMQNVEPHPDIEFYGHWFDIYKAVIDLFRDEKASK